MNQRPGALSAWPGHEYQTRCRPTPARRAPSSSAGFASFQLQEVADFIGLFDRILPSGGRWSHLLPQLPVAADRRCSSTNWSQT